MITQRDEVMLLWLENFKVATTNQINQLFYKNRTVCNKRLLKLFEDKIIKRTKDPYSNQYIYHIKPLKTLTQLKHYYIRNEFYIKLVDMGCEIEKYVVEKTMGSIIPDLCISFIYNDVKYMYFVEVERSEQKINVSKYNQFFIEDYEEFMTTKIPVVYITHKNIPRCNYTTIKVSLDLSDISNIFPTR